MRFPDDVPVLVDGDLTLRAHRLDDADAIVEQCTDPSSVRWTTVPVGYTREMAVDWVSRDIPAHWTSGHEYIFAIETTHPDGQRRFSGSLSLRDESDGRVELAFGAHPAVRGRGVMTAAVSLLLDYGFTQRGVETVVWMANVGNTGSRRVAWKSGFTFGGVLRRWLPQRGEYHDGWVAALHRDDPRTPTTRWIDTPVIRGAAVTLRPFEDRDVERIVEACTDQRTRQWLASLPHPYTVGEAQQFIHLCRADIGTGSRVMWAVADPDSDVLVAHVALLSVGRVSAEVGYWSHPAARGRGVMRAAVRLVVRHAFLSADDGGLGLHRLDLRVAAANAASIEVALANGFVECGREHEAEIVGGGEHSDVVHFELLAAQWSASREVGRQASVASARASVDRFTTGG